jgi:glutamine amidotransferase
MKKAVIVDYGMCNLDSVRRAVEECGADAEVTDDPRQLRDATHIILPGVGAFADAMAQLRARDFVTALRDRALGDRVPFLGICLGMQLMASRGTEGGDTEGLALVTAQVKRLEPDLPSTRIPHVGWNEVVPARATPLLDGVPPGKDFYFVHSYHVVPDDAGDVVATTPYCGGFVSAIGNNTTLFGVQFHPEKSQKNGFRLLKNFIAM